ncbi:MAG: T9SS type A sorting domain-containing protein [Lewinella sp.]|uniref:T9SS type A sorting domain-containing protein n=1 Tax=Lewinella sp. TaxID=2004506 RepID=UPI003D6AACC2
MKRILLLLNFLLILFIAGNGQTVTIGSGTTASGSTGSDPIDGYYNSFRYQVVYTKAELESGGTPMTINDEITGLGFDIDGDYGGGDLLDYTIKIGHTSASNASNHISVTMTTVKNAFDYNPTVTSAGSFDMISFDNNFVWNGTDNIVVEICSDGQNPFSSPYGSVRGATVTNASRRYRVDGATSCGVNTNTTNNHKPNIRFNYIDGVPPTCTGPTATFTEVENCATGFTVDINVTSMGDADSYDVQVGGSSVGTISGTGTTNVGPFTNGIPVDITLIHDSDSDCDITENGLVNATTCPTSVDCGGGGVTDTYCYTNSDFEVIEFTSSDGTSPLKITFNSGTVENTYDELIVYDSDGTTELYNGYGSSGNIAGLTFTASGSSISFGVQADISNSCVSTGQTTINYTVTCLSCTPATAGNAALSPNCPTDNSVTFDVTDMGSASSLTVTNNAGGTNPSDITSTGTGFTITGLPSDGSTVTITLTPDDDPTCAITLGPITLTACPPAEDVCTGAIDIPVASSSCGSMTTGNNTGASNSNSDSPAPPAATCTGFSGGDIWFKFTVPASGNAIISGASSDCCSYLWYELYEGSDCANLTKVSCSSTTGNNPSSFEQTVSGRTPGETLWIRAWDSSNDDGPGDFNFCVYEPCSISLIADGGTSTACNSGTNEYAQDVIVTYTAAPSTGTLDVTIDGVTVNTAITSSPQTVTVAGLTADGASKNVTAAFSDDGGCSLTTNGVFTAPAACGCGVLSITDAGTGIMNCSGATYDYEVIVTFINPPGTGTLDLTAGTGSASVAIGSSPQTVLITGLSTDGNSVNVTAAFSDDGACTTTANSLFTAPTACPPANDDLCNAIALTINSGCTGDAYTNVAATTQTNEPAGSCFSGGAQKTVWFSFTAPASGNVEITTDIAPGDLNDSEIALYGEGGSFDCTDLSTLTAQVACDQDGGSIGSGWMSVINATGLTDGATYYVQVSGYSNADGDFCIEINEPCSISAITDGGTSTACNSGTNEYSQDVIVTYSGAPASGTLDVTIDGITVNAAITSSPQTVTVSGLTADGASKNVTAVFSADGGCSLTTNGVFTAPAACGCLINSITDAGTGVMNCTGTTYDYEVIVTFNNAPGSGTLDLTAGTGSASVAIGSSPQTVLITGLTADGNNVNVTASFSANGACTASANALFTAPVACPPANNDCANATVIPVTLDGTCSNQILGTNVGATASGETPTPSCSSFGSGIDNWYIVTVPGSGDVTIEMQSAGGPTDWGMQVYTGGCGSLVRLECDDDDGSGLFPLVTLTSRTPGEELLVRVFEYSNNETGTFNICAYSTPECGENSVYLETANGTYDLDDPCDDSNGWTYYSAPGSLGNYMFAIEWDPNSTGANATAKANADVSVNIQSMITAENGTTSASYGMGRYWNVDLNGSSMNGLVNVKFFYDPAEKTAVETAASDFASANSVPNNGFSWFKTEGTAFTPGDITSSDFQSSVVLLTEDGSGTENGVTYVQFDGISSFSGGTGATGAGAGFLPVELMAFRGKTMEAGNKLSWETATEQNAAHFIIERSIDGHSRWQDLGSVAATGNSQSIQQYSYMDDKPLANAYYRLRMVDQDNSFAYSPIIQLQREAKDAGLAVFPVPAQDEVQVSFFLTQAGPVAISIFDLTGKLVSKTTLNLTVGNQQERLDISSLSSGLYLLNVEINGRRYVERLIKQ